jgi:hypothetical protein
MRGDRRSCIDLYPALELFGLPSLFVSPEAMLFDESRGLAHLIFRV